MVARRVRVREAPDLANAVRDLLGRRCQFALFYPDDQGNPTVYPLAAAEWDALWRGLDELAAQAARGRGVLEGMD